MYGLRDSKVIEIAYLLTILFRASITEIRGNIDKNEIAHYNHGTNVTSTGDSRQIKRKREKLWERQREL